MQNNFTIFQTLLLQGYSEFIYNLFTIIWFKLMWLASLANKILKLKESYSRYFSAFEVHIKDSYMPCKALAHNHKWVLGEGAVEALSETCSYATRNDLKSLGVVGQCFAWHVWVLSVDLKCWDIFRITFFLKSIF